jgi:hypothetical protein
MVHKSVLLLALFLSAAAQGREIAVKMLTPPAAPVAPVVGQLHTAGITAVFSRDNFFTDATVGRNVREFRRLLGEKGTLDSLTS